MNNILILLTIVLAIVLLIVIYHFINKVGSDLVYVKSTVDGRQYHVRNMPDKQDAADLLARLRKRLILLNQKLETHYPNDKRVKTVINRFNPNAMSEISGYANPKYTSYSVGKGKEIIFCLRSRDKNQELITDQTLTFVAVHELAHVMTISVGHTDEFWENMRFILANAIVWKLYKPVNYSENPEPYCGLQITASPLADNPETIAKYVTYDQASNIEEQFDNTNDASIY